MTTVSSIYLTIFFTYSASILVFNALTHHPAFIRAIDLIDAVKREAKH